MNNKEKVIGMVLEMPSRITVSEIVYRLHAIDEIKKGEKDIRARKYKTHDQMKKKYAKCLMK
jgi:hypothetical protein